MKESELQEAIVATAHYTGWLVYHTYDSRRSQPGFPDLVLVHPKHQVVGFVELKSATGRLSPEQELWRAALEDFPPTVRHYVWRPEDLDDAIAWLRSPT